MSTAAWDAIEWDTIPFGFEHEDNVPKNMKEKRPDLPELPASSSAPSEDHAALALREAAVLMAPVVRWLLRNGVSYGAFADQLKPVFVDAARAELERAGTRPTFSALSVLSGVHRKDVRALEADPLPAGSAAPPARGIPLSSQVYTRWLTSRRYRTRDGNPKPLPRSGGGVSFESLAREVSLDVHPRTLLDELQRLGLVRLEGELAVPVSTAFTPSRRLDELTSLFAANAADHIAAAVSNLGGGESPLLEQSVFADGLAAPSVAALQELARSAWRDAFQSMVAEATRRVKSDADIAPSERQRMRFGVYFYSEPQAAAEPLAIPPSAGAAPARARRPRTRSTP